MKIDFPTNKKARIEILPLIDIVFLLLVFFIYAMLSMSIHRGFDIVLPKSFHAKPDDDISISVTITSDNSIYIEKEKIEAQQLEVFLSKKKKELGRVKVSIFADEKIEYGTLFFVLDKINTSGMEEISLQAKAAGK